MRMELIGKKGEAELSENRKRNKSVLVRLTDEEYEMLSVKAAATEKTMPTFLRELGLKQDIESPLIRKEDATEIAKQIRMIGNNLNQLTKLAHQGQIRVVQADDARRELERLWQLLSSYRRKTPTN